MFGEFLKTLAFEDLPVDLVRHFGAGNGSLSLQAPGLLRLRTACLLLLFQDGIQKDIDAAQEEAGHRGHLAQVPSIRGQRFQACEIGVCHFAVAGEAEEQGDVDVEPLAGELPDGRQARLRGRDLDHDIGPLHQGPQPVGFLDGP